MTEDCNEPLHVYMRVHKTYPKYIFHPRGKGCFVNLISIFVKVPNTNNAKKGSMWRHSLTIKKFYRCFRPVGGPSESRKKLQIKNDLIVMKDFVKILKTVLFSSIIRFCSIIKVNHQLQESTKDELNFSIVTSILTIYDLKSIFDFWTIQNLSMKT